MSDVIVANREFAQLAQTINNSAKMLETYIVYLGNYITELSTSGGISSNKTAEALQKDTENLHILAQNIYKEVVKIVPLTDEYVHNMDRFDDYAE